MEPEWVKQLEKMSDYELTKWQGGWKIETDNYLLAEREWQRRGILRQHDLDLKLIKGQIKWMRFSAIIGVVGTLAGACLASYLQSNQKQPTKEELKTLIQQQISSSLASSRKEKAVLKP